MFVWSIKFQVEAIQTNHIGLLIHPLTHLNAYNVTCFRAGVLVLVDPHTIPINSRGEKQRMHLRDLFIKDSLNPIYVAYNM